MQELPKPLLDKLIYIGREELFEQVPSIPDVSSRARSGQFMRQRPEFWRDVASQLCDSDLVALIKTLTIAERDLDGYKAGSVAPVIWLFKVLQSRAAFGSLAELEDWILAHTNNDFLPWGASNHGARSLEEYRHLSEEVSRRSAVRRKKEADRQQSAKERKAEAATRNLMNAVRRRDIDAIFALRLKGGDVHQQDDKGVSILQYAEEAGDVTIIEALTKPLPED